MSLYADPQYLQTQQYKTSAQHRRRPLTWLLPAADFDARYCCPLTATLFIPFFPPRAAFTEGGIIKRAFVNDRQQSMLNYATREMCLS